LVVLSDGAVGGLGDTEKEQSIGHQNSVFHGVLKHVPWDRFDRLVEGHGADARVRRLSTKSQFVALLYGQLSGAASLREIVTGLSSHAVRLYHVGTDPVRRSTFSDANAQRPAAVFSELLAMMMKQAHRGLRRKLAETTYLIDATSARLNQRSAWIGDRRIKYPSPMRVRTPHTAEATSRGRSTVSPSPVVVGE